MSRLAELLGLEEERNYKFNDTIREFTFKIGAGGLLYVWSDESRIYKHAENEQYYFVLNFPNHITTDVRIWTKTDVEEAKAVRKLYPTSVSVRRDNSFGTSIRILSKIDKEFIKLEGNHFLSLKDGEEVRLSQIKEAEKYL